MPLWALCGGERDVWFLRLAQDDGPERQCSSTAPLPGLTPCRILCRSHAPHLHAFFLFLLFFLPRAGSRSSTTPWTSCTASTVSSTCLWASLRTCCTSGTGSSEQVSRDPLSAATLGCLLSPLLCREHARMEKEALRGLSQFYSSLGGCWPRMGCSPPKTGALPRCWVLRAECWVGCTSWPMRCGLLWCRWDHVV